jgi:hypothetical protein
MIQNKIVITLGTKGTGKSYWTGYAFETACNKPFVVVDYGREHVDLARLHPNAKICPIKEYMLGSINWHALLTRYYGLVCFPYKITDDQFSEEMDRLMLAIVDLENTLVLCEEVHNLAPLNRIRPGFKRLVDQGRKHRIDLYACSLRPAAIDKALVAQSDEIVLFRITEPNALDYLERLGVPVDQLPTLPDRVAILFNTATREQRLITAGVRRTHHYG